MEGVSPREGLPVPDDIPVGTHVSWRDRMRHSASRRFGSAVPIATAAPVPEAQNISNAECVTLLHKANDDHLWCERELHRWEGNPEQQGGSIWKDHTWFKPKLVDGEWSLYFKEKTTRGKEGHLKMLKDLEKDLKRLVGAYGSARSDDECRSIRRSNDDVYRAIQFIRHDYEEHVGRALYKWGEYLQERGVDYADPDGPNYDEGQEHLGAENEQKERLGRGRRAGRGRDEHESRWRGEQWRRAQEGLVTDLPENQPIWDPVWGTPAPPSGGRRRTRPRTRRKKRPRRRTRARRRARSRSRSRPTRRRRRR